MMNALSDQWMNSDYASGVVSVIIPTFNRAELLSKALESVRKQSYRPIEIIVVDDGSKDSTASVVQDFSRALATDDITVKYIHQAKEGAPTARNRGLLTSTGEFIQFLDSDDLLHPSKLELQIGALERHVECEFVWSDHCEFDDGAEPSSYPISGEMPLEIVTAQPFVIPGTVWCGVYRRSACISNGPWIPSLKKWQDLEYAIRFSCTQVRKCIYIKSILYFQRLHDKGRIKDLYYKTDGVSAGLHSLEAIKRSLTTHCKWDQRIAKEVGKFYLGLVRQGIAMGTRDQVIAAMDGAKSMAADWKFRLKVHAVSGLYSTLGGGLTLACLRLYYRYAGYDLERSK